MPLLASISSGDGAALPSSSAESPREFESRIIGGAVPDHALVRRELFLQRQRV
jgi:hypothetical protein